MTVAMPGRRFPASRPERKVKRAWFSGLGAKLLLPGTIFLSVALLILYGDARLVAVPPIVVFLVWGMLTLPFQMVAPAVAGLMLTVPPPGANPASNKWVSPIDWVGKVVYQNLPFKLALADIIIVLLMIRATMIVLLGDGLRGAGTRRPPRPFAQACIASVLAVLFYGAYGIAKGGDFRQALWQTRVPILLAFMALAASVAATPIGIKRFRNAVLFAGMVKVVLGAWFYWTILPNLADKDKIIYVTIHSDTVLWASGLAMLMAEWFEQRTIGSRRRLLVFGLPLIVGMIINNRRTVWVSVAASALFIMAVATPHVKRQLAKLLAVFWPVIFVYVALGLSVGSNKAVFKPVNMLESVLLQDDASSDSRKVENLNLLFSNKLTRGIGTGFGHPYAELIPAVDLVEAGFEQYQFIPHNSFLGLWVFMGVPGATVYFMLPAMGIFYATWARRRSAVPWQRAASAWSVCIVIAWLIQSWSDIGVQDWTSMICCGFALGIGASLARQVADQGELSGVSAEEVQQVQFVPALVRE
jgi:O-Antigen ligase